MARPNNPDFQAQKLLSSVSLDLLGKKAKEHTVEPRLLHTLTT